MGIIYSGPSGDQYKKWAAEQEAVAKADTADKEALEAKIKELEAKVAEQVDTAEEVVEEVKPKTTTTRKPAAKK